ncbi:MAG: CcmD family protein [Actinobacteria bacterium]|nr:CcmD family protein [Actinomycetota bacterium]
MSDTAWLFIAFMVVWIALGAYLFSIAARQNKVDRRLDELDRGD